MSKKANLLPKGLTYTQAMNRLEEIVTRLQNEQCDIETLRDYTSQAMQLLQFCKTRLTETDTELKKLLDELGKE